MKGTACFVTTLRIASYDGESWFALDGLVPVSNFADGQEVRVTVEALEEPEE